jgi:hypothetical protein
VSHNIILDRYNILQESRQLSLTEDLFEWMHKQTLGDEKDICPLLGIIKIPCCTWTYLSTQMPYAQTQKELATYLAGAATDDHARETAYEVVNGYLAQHKGEEITILFNFDEKCMSKRVVTEETDYLPDIL